MNYSGICLFLDVRDFDLIISLTLSFQTRNQKKNGCQFFHNHRGCLMFHNHVTFMFTATLPTIADGKQLVLQLLNGYNSR